MFAGVGRGVAGGGRPPPDCVAPGAPRVGAALARVRELVERFGAAAYFNGHAHGLQHVAPASMPTTPGGEAPRTTRYVTSGAGSTVRAMENATRLPEELTFFRDDGPGFVVVRANARRLSITHHAAPGGEALFQEMLVA